MLRRYDVVRVRGAKPFVYWHWFTPHLYLSTVYMVVVYQYTHTLIFYCVYLLLLLLLLLPDHCTHPLGMESGNITDKQITASSAHDIGNVGPQHAR